MAKNRLSTIFRTMFDKDHVINVCYNHTGKMAGMYSISTACTLNKYCIERAKNKESICADCFAQSMFKNGFYKWTLKRCEHNTHILTTTILDVVDLPLINAFAFRFEAFGDIQNTTQVINYFNICNYNRRVTFAIWTKNPFIIANAIRDGHKKPENLIIIYSSPIKNKAVSLERIQAVFPFVDKVFTVWTDEETATANGVRINCGAKACMKCLKCYTKNDSNVISELLK